MFTQPLVAFGRMALLLIVIMTATITPYHAYAQEETVNEIWKRSVELYYDQEYDDALREIEQAVQQFPESILT